MNGSAAPALLRRLALLFAVLAALLLGARSAGAWVQCPPGQISLDGSTCIIPQGAPYVPSGIGAQQSVLPESGPNGAPALRSCNGSPTPIGQPCPGDPKPQGTTSAQPAISVSLAPAGSGPIVGPVTQATVGLQSVLGDWYTGWMSYLATALNWSDANQSYIAALFGTIPGCAQGQQSQCQQGVWVQILPWYLLLVPGANVSVNTPAPPPQTATAATATAASASSAPAASPANSSAETLLGDWYDGWLAYAAASLNWDDAQTSTARAYFAAAAPCAGGQKDACQAFVMQQLSAWLNPAPAASGS
jgi:hypothetical protein